MFFIFDAEADPRPRGDARITFSRFQTADAHSRAFAGISLAQPD